MGFDARWGVLGAADIGANHQRDRIWIVARWKGDLSHAQHNRIRWWEQQQESIKEAHGELANPFGIGLESPWPQQQTTGIIGKSEVAHTRCELWSKGDSGIVDTQEKIGTSSPILNQSGGEGCGEDQVANAREIRPCGEKTEQGLAREFRLAECGMDRDWWQREPEFVPRTTQRNMGGVADGLASRVDRLKAIGNGQVPLCAATAWRLLNDQK
jgi:DNA (cytosine-5)-methyltransferase 1